MKKVLLSLALSAMAFAAFANYRVEGTFQSSCGTWSYVIHPTDIFDQAARYWRLVLAAEDACKTGATMVVA